MRKILVQNCQTRMFLRDDGQWTPHPMEARNFETSLNAMAYCLQTTLSSAQIVLKFDAPGARDVVVPVEISKPARMDENR